MSEEYLAQNYKIPVAATLFIDSELAGRWAWESIGGPSSQALWEGRPAWCGITGIPGRWPSWGPVVAIFQRRKESSAISSVW